MRRENHTVDGAQATIGRASRLLLYQIGARFAWQRGSVISAMWRRAQCAAIETGHATAMTAKPSRLPGRRILLAEDDDSMRGFIERALIKADYEVMSFANGREAYEQLQRQPFTLLLTDIVMPQMDGIELARRASELKPDLKIMFITGFAAVTLNTSTRAVRDAQVLSKPFHLKDLVREIDRLLGAKA
jgi:two-component system cell cycle response regulator CpdR